MTFHIEIYILDLKSYITITYVQSNSHMFSPIYICSVQFTYVLSNSHMFSTIHNTKSLVHALQNVM